MRRLASVLQVPEYLSVLVRSTEPQIATEHMV